MNPSTLCSEVYMGELTPMMRHYLDTKEEYKDCIIFYRLGDFYEMFFDDAKLVSKELELTLTKKSCGLEERAPMCGVPYHSVDTYLTRLVKKGYKVAICEQVENPKEAKGMVKREVVRIVTPGTNIDANALDESKNNYIMSIVHVDRDYGISLCDITTGDFMVSEMDNSHSLIDEINKFAPSEIICNETFLVSGIDLEPIKYQYNTAVTPLANHYFEEYSSSKVLEEHFKVDSISALGLNDFPLGASSAGGLLTYLIETQKSSLAQLNSIKPYVAGEYMLLDSATRRNLELVMTLRDKEKKGSLLGILDKTKTAMGARTLRGFIEQPLINPRDINNRLDVIEELSADIINREEIREYLSGVYDLERLMTRVSYETANPRDLIALKNTLDVIPGIISVIKDYSSALFTKMNEEIDDLRDIYKLIDDAIAEEPPITVREGGIIKLGYNEEVDMLRRSKTDGKSWLASLESRERDKTNIKNLKVKYNKVFGYYLEVTNSYLELVPDYFIRKQTLTNCERFYTEELKDLENTILNSQEKLSALEYDIYKGVLDTINDNIARIQKTAKILAHIDVFAALSYVSEKNHYVRPALNSGGFIDIKGGRHPVVEKMLKDNTFVDNDTYLDLKKNRVSIITGPNMAGKSTYMRQVALITLMAQIGCFVPASSANISIVDRIFTRVGASDDLASGQSTFMVEMNEVANILRNATSKSLIILDEIGRGTSTFDGLSIAWAVVEYIADTKILGAKTLFATHYHELTELEGKLSGVNNYCIAVKENGDDIVFIRKIVPGGADKSYGIQVARLAGVPDMVIDRAKEIINELIENDIADIAKSITVKSKTTKTKKLDEVDISQMSMFDTVTDEDIIKELREINVNELTPVEALSKLDEITSKVRNRL